MPHAPTLLKGPFEVNPISEDAARRAPADSMAVSERNDFATFMMRGLEPVQLHAATVWAVYAVDVETGGYREIHVEPHLLRESPLQLPGAGLTRNVFATSPSTLWRRQTVVYVAPPYGSAYTDNPMRWTDAETRAEADRLFTRLLDHPDRLPGRRLGAGATVQDLMDGGLHLSAVFGYQPGSTTYGGLAIASEVDPFHIDRAHPEVVRLEEVYVRTFGPDSPQVREITLLCEGCSAGVTTYLPINRRGAWGEYVFNVKVCAECGTSGQFGPSPLKLIETA